MCKKKKPDWDKSFDVQVKKPVQCTSMAYDIVSCSSLTIIYLNMNINEVCLVLIVLKNMYFRWVTVEILRFLSNSHKINTWNKYNTKFDFEVIYRNKHLQ